MSRVHKTVSDNLDKPGQLYRAYAEAVDSYVKQPTVNNWERKEKAFENYNDLLASTRRRT